MRHKPVAESRRPIKILLGFSLLLVGIALIVLPGPALVVIPLSLAILGGEFVWANRLNRSLLYHLKKFRRSRDRRRNRRKAARPVKL